MKSISDTFLEFIEFKKSYCEDETIRYYNENIANYLKWLENVREKSNITINELTKHDLIGYIAFLRTNKRLGNVSIKTYYRAIKVFFKYMFEEGYIDSDVTKKVKLPKPDKKVKLPLSVQEVDAIDNQFDKTTYMGLRNYLIIHLMIDCGLRSSEVISLKVADIDFENRYISINNSKCNKSRVVPMNENLVKSISEYLSYHNQDYLFYDRYLKDRITSNTIKQLFMRLKKSSGVKRVHAHLLRHTFATSCILGGGSLEILRLLLGHSDYNVTKEYLHIVAEIQILQYDIYKLDKCLFRNYNYNY